MNRKRLSIEDKLAVNKYDIDKEVHIKIYEEICKECDEYSCVYACPADCFKLWEDHITFSYEGCLECGSCQIVCDKDAIDWTLPRAGFGICYEYG
ncbi:MAG: 4Fe-4S dicluster domain-containing protein [Candidatus Aminicenantes bacterium]|nr:4Fe-4S dicluster domain-containing protein [Candidatus Aminicenantes bacterium]